MSKPVSGANAQVPPAVTSPAETNKTTLRAQVYANYQNTENKIYKFAKMIFLTISYPIAALLDGFIAIANWFTTQKPEDTSNKAQLEQATPKAGKIARVVSFIKEFHASHKTAINRTACVAASLTAFYFTGSYIGLI